MNKKTNNLTTMPYYNNTDMR